MHCPALHLQCPALRNEQQLAAAAAAISPENLDLERRIEVLSHSAGTFSCPGAVISSISQLKEQKEEEQEEDLTKITSDEVFI
ncbi:hypothetical protein AXG93_1913s1650 [Marchantia polymorpha subsp. ruderalis]|uniref:Uncharacterized protein n=1 Tax=Marchantia polymorpha subsp. ruderalis TaxID=1480154 RepID=A0A176WKA5_MARPO|nr:hypothetical protein AXG93_1913s1650 [Marchantia polymorpha subsp. ruderalis]